jgi:hypothetical protein
MIDIEGVLRSFAFEPGLDMWEAEVFVPFWGGPIPVRIAAPAGGPSRRQAQILEAILSYQGDLRSQIEESLFAYYKQKVEGTAGYFERGVDVTAQRAPKLHGSGEVWGLLSAIAVYIPACSAAANEAVFELHMDCSWDADHGLCVRIRDWRVAKIAGQMDCKGGV